MKRRKVCSNLLIILFAVTSIKGMCQITLANIPELEKVKQGTTFIAMKDPDAVKAIPFVEAFDNHWTYNKVKCIKYSDVEKNIAPNNSFITIGATLTTSNNPNNSSDTRVFLEYWTTNGKFVYDPKKRRHFNQEDKIVLATVELSPDFITQSNPSSLYRMEYDANGHIKNWGSGIVANYIQALQLALNKANPKELKEDFINKEALQKLNGSTLLLPEYVLTKYSKNSGDETKKMEAKELMSDYPFTYKVVTIDELNTKIADKENPFYYLLLIKSGDDKIVTITNSKTGEIIYSAFTSNAPSLKSSDSKEIVKAIQKK
jgi:hypothetical protein